MAYLYRHIRLDTKTPFYIGIGSDENYTRAYDKRSRNRHWSSIVKKANYEVEIVLDNLSWEEACDKEIEFIKLYGRKDLNEGCLCNMTNGGDGMLGVRPSDEKIKRFVDSIRREVIQYDMQGNIIREYESASQAKKITGISESQITSNCKGHKGKKSAGGFIWRYKDPKEWFSPIYSNHKNAHCHNQKHQKKVLQYDIDGNLIAEYRSIRYAEEQTKVARATIIACCKGKYKHAGGFIWKFKIQ